MQRDIDERLYAIVKELESFNLTHHEISHELHDAVERVLGEDVF